MDVQGVETNGAQPGNGLFRLRLPALFVSQQGLNGSIPPPGLFVWNGLAAPAVAKYNNGVNDGIRKLFVAALAVRDGTGAVPDDEEWWRGAWLSTNDISGELIVANPFGQADIPDDAELTLAGEGIEGLDNPFADFETLSWTADAAEGLGEPIPLVAPTNSGAAAFVLTLSSEKYGLLAKDRVRVNVPAVDLDIDSDNDDGFSLPDRDEDEDEYEDASGTPARPGKILLVNDGDDDLDGIPGYADGYDLLATDTDDDASAGAAFVPVVFTLSDAIDPARAAVRVTYPASDPGAVATNGLGGYALPSGSLRLWARDGSVARSANPVWHAAAPGDYLPPTPAGGVPAAQLGFTSGVRAVTFYAEAVRPSAGTADIRILFEVDPDGDVTNCPAPGFIAADAVRITAVRLGLTPDFDRDGKIDDVDKALLLAKGQFRIWINDDRDEGYWCFHSQEDSPAGSYLSIPESHWWNPVDWFVSSYVGDRALNCNDEKVNDVRDMVDFFPVSARAISARVVRWLMTTERTCYVQIECHLGHVRNYWCIATDWTDCDK